MSISSGEDAQQSARLGMFRLGTARLNAPFQVKHVDTGDNNRYLWQRYEDDVEEPTWTTVSPLPE